jgi:hypothetical protein
LLQHQVRHELIYRQRLVHLRLHLRLVVIGLHVGGGRFLLQQVVVQLHLGVGQAGFGRLQLQGRVLQLLFELRVGQLEDHIVRLHLRAGAQDDLFHPALRRCRNPPDVFRRQYPEAAHLAHHRPTLHRVGPDHRALDRRRRGFQTGQADADEHDGQQTDAGVDRLADPFLLCIGRARNIHGCVVCLDGNFRENDRAVEGQTPGQLSCRG